MLRQHIANLNRRALQYRESDPEYGLMNSDNDGVNDGVNDCVKPLNKTLLRVYRAIVDNPEITSSELMKILNISESTVTRSTRELKKPGFIEREGSDKTGRWIILK